MPNGIPKLAIDGVRSRRGETKGRAEPSAPQPRGKNTLSREVYLRLKNGIFDFSLSPGQRYSEYELAELLDVSRTPLRLALHVLGHEGYLQHVGGHSCWQVRPLDLSYYEDLYDFRVEIEALAMRMIDKAQSLSALTDLRDFWCAPAAKRNMDGDIVGQQDEHFHIRLVGFAENKAMSRTFADLTDRIRVIRRLDFTTPARILATYAEHAAIIAVLEKRDLGTAEALVRQHIETSRIEIRKITFHNLAIARSIAPIG
jgi:DNA-binding GntR family transcriptional regulator